MYKVLTIFILCLGIVHAGDVKLKDFKKLEMFSDGKLTLERVYDHGSLYQVYFTTKTPQGTQRFSAFLTKDKKVLIAGEAVNLKTKEPLTLPKQPLNMKLIKQQADIIYGTGKTKLIVVTDPECHYCQVFQNRWSEIKNKYTLYVYLYPLSHHRDAKQMSYHVLSQKSSKKKSEALIGIAKEAKLAKIAAQNGQSYQMKQAYKSDTFSKKQINDYEAKLIKNKSLADTLGVRGTPAVYDVKGDFVMWNKLF